MIKNLKSLYFKHLYGESKRSVLEAFIKIISDKQVFIEDLEKIKTVLGESPLHADILEHTEMWEEYPAIILIIYNKFSNDLDKVCRMIAWTNDLIVFAKNLYSLEDGELFLNLFYDFERYYAIWLNEFDAAP